MDAGALTLLGSPMMSGDGLDSVLASKKNDLMILAGRLNFLPAHDSLYLLRNVVTTPMSTTFGQNYMKENKIRQNQRVPLES